MIKKCKEFDKESFSKLVHENSESLYRIAFSYTYNREDALDVVQEAVYKAYINKESLKNIDYFKTWLVRITINCAKDLFRKRKNIVEFSDECKLEYEMSCEGRFEYAELYTELEKLDERARTIIILRFFEDLTLKDISDILEIPINTVKTILYRTLEKLKINLEEEK